jgi:type VI secretion system protein ImpK
MSDQDRPRNPFGRGERTIIRPNPGGRLPAAPGGGAAPSAAPPYQAPSPSAPSRPQSPPPGYGAPPPPSYAPPPTTYAAEDWIRTGEAPPQQQNFEAQKPPLQVDDLVAPNANPIMRAGGPLLQLLGRLRVAVLRASAASLMEQVADAIKFFEKDIRSAGISEQQANTAKYILCATADDIVQHIPTEERHVWAQYSMLSRFFGERIGGVRFYDLLTQNKLDPLVNYPVLELFHACLALGFQGVYRTQAGGLATLQLIQRDLYETLRRVRPKVMRDLSPHWQGQALGLNSGRTRVPVWAVAATAAALLFGAFVALRILLSGSADAAAFTISTLHSHDPLELHRRVIAPPPPPPPPDTQVARLRRELDNGECSVVDETANQIIIRLCDQITFDPGQATIKDQFKPIAAKLASVLDKEPGHIQVVGNTDNTPIHNVRFPSNFELSVARAQAVAAVLKQQMTDPNRIGTEGKGPDNPVVSNATPEGRAKNRRVEVMIQRSSE